MKQNISLTHTKAAFQNPDSEFRSLPFWAWNATLEEKEIRHQIKEMKRAGIGGFFMHSRVGLETPYLEAQWDAAISAAVDEAKSQQMEAWLYDEDRWPAGTAGGSLPRKYGDASRCKGFTLEVTDPNDIGWQTDGSKVLARYQAKVEGMDILSLKRLANGEMPAPNKVQLVTRLEVSGGSDWFNGEAPPDNLSAVAVQRFLESTYKHYYQLVGKDFGKTIPGIFTDEPSLHDNHASFPQHRGWIPWTTGLEDFFQQRRGYDPFDLLPYLYFHGTHSKKIRHDYWWTISEAFSQAYSEQIGNWCKEHGLGYTGHFLQEEKLGLSTRVNGSIMPHYKHQAVPGIDMLREETYQFNTVKQCSSVANQFDKPMVLSETYGCTGWSFSFEGQKWIGDWQFALGVNRLSKHLAFYSLRGCRKRDYPPNFNYNTTWWRHSPVIEDYFARLSAVLTGGKPLRDLLVLHPQSTAWARLGCSPYGNPIRREERDISAIDAYGYEFNDLLTALSGFHYDYDLGDEMLMASDGKISGTTISIGSATYQALLLPPVDTLLSSTVALLQEFLNNGGTVLGLTPLPTCVEGVPFKELESLFASKNFYKVSSFPALMEVLPTVLPRKISIQDRLGRENENLLALLEDRNDSYALFIANHDRDNSYSVTIHLSSLEEVVEVQQWDALTGKISLVEHTATEAGHSFSKEFSGAESALYILPKEKFYAPSRSLPVLENKPVKTFFTSFSPECTVSRDIPNSLPLDFCSYRFAGKDWSQPMEVWAAQKELRDTLDMREIHHNGHQQRYLWADTPHPQDHTPVEFRFCWTAEFSAENCWLVLETPWHYSLTVNGKDVPSKSDGWFIDPAFEKIPLPPLAKGQNTLILSCPYQNSMEVEVPFLLGEFQVNQQYALAPDKDTLRTGDWTLQGYPFYAGSLFYEFTLDTPLSSDKRYFLELDDFVATTVAVTVNGTAKNIPWKSAGLFEVTSLLQGEDTIVVEVSSSPRNLLGPFHLAEGHPKNTQASSFTPTGSRKISGYQLHPYGLYSSPKLYTAEK